jgi:hypothetical protein
MGHCVLLFQPASACFSEANLRECGRVSGIYTRECQVCGHYMHLQQTRGKYFGFEVIFVVIENLRWAWIMMRHASHAVWPASMEQKLLSTPFHNSHFIRSVLKYSSKGPTRASKSLACDRDKNIIRNCILWVCNPAREMKWTCMHYTLPPTLYHILLQNQLHVCGVVLYHS